MPLMFPACESVLFRRMSRRGKGKENVLLLPYREIRYSGIFLSYFPGWGVFFKMFCTLFCTTLMGRA